MSQIRGKNTQPEILVRKFLFSNGLRYKIHDKRLPGKPDIVLPKYKTIILVHGCFWHGHENCKDFVTPKTNTRFWINKIEKTKENDRRNISLLELKGWTVIVIYQCELKKNKRDETLNELINKIY